ncbi:unnamed protein product [Durusdinium trenchii]|uniref:Uncharacterized protein n=1 Tax=Durusdinium trenchii TaxID=1381693 RepID=A0ABP0PPK9_9DINO
MPRPSTGHSTVRAKAFFILLLLGGHEAVRIHEDVNLTALTYQNEDPMWEKVYRDMNKDCYWMPKLGYCHGDGCVWKPLTLDHGFNDQASCRKSDKYLLKMDPHNSMQMFAGILKAKSEKYAKKCQGRFSGWNLKCKRRLQHMVNAVRFMALAKDELNEKPQAEEQKALQDSFTSSLSNMAETFGEDGALVGKLKDKILDSDALKENPEGTVKKMVDLITKLTQGSKAEHDEAKNIIEATQAFEPDQLEETTTQDDTSGDMVGEEEKDLSEAQEEVNEELLGLDPIPSSSDGTSALEVMSSVDGQMIAAVLLAVVAVGATIVISAIISQVVFAALMAYAFLSAFGCGVYYAGRYQGENKQIEAPEEAEKKEDAVDKKDGKTENQTGEGGEVAEKGMSKWSAVKKGLICTGRYIILPFKLVWKLGKWVVKGIRKVASKKGNSTKAE